MIDGDRSAEKSSRFREGGFSVPPGWPGFFSAGPGVPGLLEPANQGTLVHFLAGLLATWVGWGRYVAWLPLFYLAWWAAGVKGQTSEPLEKPAGVVMLYSLGVALVSALGGDGGLLAGLLAAAGVGLISDSTIANLVSLWPRSRPAEVRMLNDDRAPGGPVGTKRRPSAFLDRRPDLPPLADIFPPGSVKAGPEAGLSQRQGEPIKQALEELGVPVDIKGAQAGPTVTRYYLALGHAPAKSGSGPRRVRVGQVLTLKADLELALGVSPLRLQTPVAGTSYLGLDVPHGAKGPVRLGDLLASQAYPQAAAKPLCLALGKILRASRPFITWARGRICSSPGRPAQARAFVSMRSYAACCANIRRQSCGC